MVVMIGERSRIKFMVDNNYVAARYSLLSDFIIEAQKTALCFSVKEITMKEPDKRIVFAVRLIMIAWGLIIGWTFAQFIFRLYPDYLSAGYELIVQMVNAVVFAVILSTLARPVSAFALFIGRLLRKTFLEKPLYVTVGAVLGAVIGVMTGVLANAIVEVFTSLFAARFIVAFSAAVLGAYTGYLGCRRWLSSTFTDDENVVIEYSGYILTYSAFFSDKVVYVAQLINGKIYILGKTLRRLIELADTDAAAKKRWKTILSFPSTAPSR